MRYLQDKELQQYVERELLPGLAEDCAAEFYERFGHSLDNSPASLKSIDSMIAAPPTPLDEESLAGPLGAYLGAVFCCCDGARWTARFDRQRGIDGYQASRLRLYDEEIDVFTLARQAIRGDRPLADSFQRLHRSFRPSPPASRGSLP